MKFVIGVIVGAIITVGILLHVPWYWFVIGGLVGLIGVIFYFLKDLGNIWG